jgi:uronate dehydrogenase
LDELSVVKTILLTGAAGIVGSLIRPLLSQHYSRVVLTDIAEVNDVVENERFLRGDIVDSEFVIRAAAGVDAIIHLAGMVGPDYSFIDVLGPNIIGTHNIFNAARKQRIDRVVYASSHHAVGYYRRDQGIDDRAAPRPDSQYGLSKAFGESAGSYFWDKFGIHVLAIRIGYVGPQAIDERRLHTWISPRDLVQLIDIGTRTPNLGFQIVYGVSENPAPFFDNANATRLGYRPMDRATDHLADAKIAIERADPATLEGAMVGGPFASLGFVGDPDRLLRFGENES